MAQLSEASNNYITAKKGRHDDNWTPPNDYRLRCWDAVHGLQDTLKEEPYSSAVTNGNQSLLKNALRKPSLPKDLLKDMCKGVNKGRYSYGMEIKRRFLIENGYDAAGVFHEKLKNEHKKNPVKAAIRKELRGGDLDRSFMLSDNMIIDEANSVTRKKQKTCSINESQYFCRHTAQESSMLSFRAVCTICTDCFCVSDSQRMDIAGEGL